MKRLATLTLLLFLSAIGACKHPVPQKGPLPAASQALCEPAEDYDVRIVFTGICVFVSDRGLSSGTFEPPLRVLLVNGRDTADKDDRHEAYLLFDEKYWVEDPAVQLPDSPRSSRHKVLELDGETISLDPLSVPDRINGSLDFSMEGIGSCPTTKDQTSMRWVPSLFDVSGVRAVDPSFLDSNDASKISARMELTRGKLAPCISSPQQWRFHADEEGTLTQVIPQEVVYELKGEKGRDLAVTVGGRTLHFCPQRDDRGNNKVELVIGNTRPDDIGPLPGGVTTPSMQVDHHFDLYYRLMNPPAGARHRLPEKLTGSVCTSFPPCSSSETLVDRGVRAVGLLPSEAAKKSSKKPSGPSQPSPQGENCGPVRLP